MQQHAHAHASGTCSLGANGGRSHSLFFKLIIYSHFSRGFSPTDIPSFSLQAVSTCLDIRFSTFRTCENSPHIPGTLQVLVTSYLICNFRRGVSEFGPGSRHRHCLPTNYYIACYLSSLLSPFSTFLLTSRRHAICLFSTYESDSHVAFEVASRHWYTDILVPVLHTGSLWKPWYASFVPSDPEFPERSTAVLCLAWRASQT